MKDFKNYIIIGVLLLLSGLMVGFQSSINITAQNYSKSRLLNANVSKLDQGIIKEVSDPVSSKVLYAFNEVIGTVTDLDKIEAMINDVNKDLYEEEFPDSKLGFGEDVFIAEEMSYFIKEDIDQEIKNYIVENDLLAIESNKITFSNGAIIYVKNLEDFESAKEKYLLNFVSERELEYIREGEIPPLNKDVGSTAKTLEILEKSTVSSGYASIENIYLDERSIIEFLSYGFEVETEYYTVEAFDTVDGVAFMAGISPQQLMTINPQIKSRDQLLKEGEKLNVTYFDSPINVIVKKHTVKDEVIYPESTKYVNDPTLREGVTVTSVYEKPGSQRVTYEETYVNGQLKDGAEILAKEVLVAPVREVIRRGTMVMPRVGSGSFRYPVDNPSITCGWYCYPGHQATDFINAYNRYGSVRASDRGVVSEASYKSINGYYVVINHNNGYTTYYGHLNTRPYVNVGQTVSRGEVIGQIGSTGYSTGPHVHFEVRLNGRRINPMTVIGR